MKRPCFDGVRGWILNIGLAVCLFSSATAMAAVHYVDVNSTNPTPPYTNWSTAATNIQDAVDAAAAGDRVVVTNGFYATGGRMAVGVSSTNRVAVDKPLSLRSVNGPQFTILDGGQSVRCVYLTNDVSLSGFTLTNGTGGVFGESWTATVSNCVISGNVLYGVEGGAFNCTLNNCTLKNNWAFFQGGGASYCRLYNCELIGNTATDDGSFDQTFSPEGGGAYQCILANCTLAGNSAIRWVGFNSQAAYGGGASYCTLNNCTLTGNQAFATDESGMGSWVFAYGGGAYESTLNNCTLAGNAASVYRTNNFIGDGGGAYGCVLNNTIDYLNFPDNDANYGSNTWNHSWTSNPLLVDRTGGNLRLQSNSPCINAGNNAYAAGSTDLDGNLRIAGGTVDIGAYEFQAPVSMISYAWLQQYGLPINSATDTADPDGDGVNNYHEWLAGTNPTNQFSSPAQLTITPSGIPPSGITLAWSTNAVGFTLQSTTNLVSPVVWSTNSTAPVVIAGQNTVTNPITGAQQFYRLIQ
jgi:hypothetical protein